MKFTKGIVGIEEFKTLTSVLDMAHCEEIGRMLLRILDLGR